MVYNITKKLNYFFYYLLIKTNSIINMPLLSYHSNNIIYNLYIVIGDINGHPNCILLKISKDYIKFKTCTFYRV